MGIKSINPKLMGPENIGERMRMARRERGMTQSELGQLSGTNQAVIQKIENGGSLRPRDIMRISHILQVNPAWLQFGEPWAKRDLPK